MVAAVLELATQPVGGRCSTRCIPYSTASPDLSDPGLQPRPGRHCARPRRYRLPAVAIGLPIVCRNPAPLSLSSFHSFCDTFPPKMSVGFIPFLSPPPILSDLFHLWYFLNWYNSLVILSKQLILRKIQKTTLKPESQEEVLAPFD